MSHLVIFDHALFIANGLSVTLGYTFISWIFGFIISLGLLFLKRLNSFWDFVVGAFVSVIRGTPLMVQLVFLYYVLRFPGPVAAICAFTVNSAAYTSEILRGALMSIGKGQFDAAHALGIPKHLLWRDILFPQMLRTALPGITGEVASLIKETSILAIISENDIMRLAIERGQVDYQFIWPIMIVGCYYYFISGVLTVCFKLLEGRVLHHVKIV